MDFLGELPKTALAVELGVMQSSITVCWFFCRSLLLFRRSRAIIMFRIGVTLVWKFYKPAENDLL